jgi:hypothetical protein
LESNFVLLAVGAQHSYGVAISNGHHSVEEGVGLGNAKQ